MAVTIKDVAKAADVAPSTVSRVISDSPKISEKTKRKVRKVMDDLGYHLNLNARVLVQQSTQTIGIVMKNSTSESLHNPFFPEVLRGISALCNKQDFSLTITTGESEESIFQDVVKMVQGKRVDGMIVSYSKKYDKVVPYLLKCGIPFVVVGKPVSNASEIMYVDNDNVQAAKEAAEHLIQLGHTQIGYIGGDPEFELSDARLNGFKEAIRQHQIHIPESYVKNPDETVSIQQTVSELMDSPTPPTGLVVTDDLTALNVLLALRDKDILVPEDVSVISFNNTMISKLSTPPLTSVDTQIYQLGYESARCLIEEIKDPSTFKKSVIIPTIIKQRDSSIAYKPKRGKSV
ncbi:LacI family transcriptional regulator [Radiobacillus kanasensis]|uniref:LacI family DNA-binding transcriptional regulator n=1 Tax=Radiobacillus kanasensis TaxID=2844358 RepID=UPI001E2A3E1C|nr:LacI family DNA-binding transcriptional regulator [Radiobacillus kanasensis]UFT99228.1 LacI family transcriptional regulator [Radiobacillus kanasensis]